MKIKILEKQDVKKKPTVILEHSRKCKKTDYETNSNYIKGNTITEYFNCRSLKKGFSVNEILEKNEEYMILQGVQKRKNDSYIWGCEASWDEDDLCIIVYMFNNTWDYVSSPRFWREINRIYFNRDKKALGQKYQAFYFEEHSSNHRSFLPIDNKKLKSFFDTLKLCTVSVNMKYNNHYIEKNSLDVFFEELFSTQHLHKLHLVQGNHILKIDSIKALIDYFNYVEPKRTNSSIQQKLDELTTYKLSDIKSFNNLTSELIKCIKFIDEKINTGYLNNRITKFAILEKVETNTVEQCCCIRIFGCISKEHYLREVSRFYITKTDIIPARIHYNTDWIKGFLSSDIDEYLMALDSLDEEICKGTKLEYISSIIKNFDISVRGTALYLFMQNPIFEMLYKLPENKDDKLMNFNQFLMNSLLSKIFIGTEDSLINSSIGNIEEKGNIFKRLKLNKYQFKKLSSLILNNSSYLSFFDYHNYYIYTRQYNANVISPVPIIKIFKECFKNYFDNRENIIFNISDLCNEDTDKLIDALFYIATFNDNEKKCSSNYMVNNYSYLSSFSVLFSKILNIWDITTAINCIDDLIYFVLNNERLSKQISSNNSNYLKELYTDSINILRNLKNANHSISIFKPYIKGSTEEKTVENIIRMHSEISILYNSIKDEVNMEKFNNSVKKCEQWEYDNPEYDYIVKKPIDPSEIANEGIILHHCVKGFIPNVVEGQTNIMFVRKRNSPNTPFFTAEIKNNGLLRQIHGFGNRNINTEGKEFEEFISLWCKEKKIKKSSSYNSLLNYD